MTIKVHGETYANADELEKKIEELRGELAEMPSDTPEHNALSNHVDKLETELLNHLGLIDRIPDPDPDEETDEEHESELPEDELEPTHDLQIAAETGAPIACPTCGQEVPFPEAPPINPNVEQCPDCHGWGKLVNPTRVDGWIWQPCDKCSGNGFVRKDGNVIQHSVRSAATSPQLAGSTWNIVTRRWDPPTVAENPPWEGATWDGYEGKWS